MKESKVRRLLWINFGFVIVVEALLWASGWKGLLNNTLVAGLGLVLVVDLLVMSIWLTRAGHEVYWYLLVVGGVLGLDLLTVSLSSAWFLFTVAQASYFLGCLAVKGLSRWFHHRFVIAWGWDFFLDWKNSLFTLVLFGITIGLTLVFLTYFTKI